MSHDCRSLLCDTPHYDEHSETCSCESCHAYHQENGIQNYQDSSCCEDQVVHEQDLGIRCVHGEVIPYVADPRDHGRYSFITDVECPKCQIDYGPSCLVDWQQILNSEINRMEVRHARAA